MSTCITIEAMADLLHTAIQQVRKFSGSESYRLLIASMRQALVCSGVVDRVVSVVVSGELGTATCTVCVVLVTLEGEQMCVTSN